MIIELQTKAVQGTAVHALRLRTGLETRSGIYSRKAKGSCHGLQGYNSLTGRSAIADVQTLVSFGPKTVVRTMSSGTPPYSVL